MQLGTKTGIIMRTRKYGIAWFHLPARQPVLPERVQGSAE